ncbi:MAG: type II toxin-antitoxin system RatA family toxin [Alphaproteobacteria bacterium]|jgi:coenzyme Q-binding protein COQ10|nr:type II toxin-antitoxin system RatA family toxin [Alphaproteobacteria bacterium]MBT5859989.1 type II toxin-antitoxin system RatA family toxin [Alphaproteobacteria bacterium]
MPSHSEQRLLPHTPEHLFDLVADIAKYPEFLPWCADASILSEDGDTVTADLVIGFKMFRERFTSEVVLDRPNAIEVRYKDGPFKNLTNHWKFLPGDDGGCIVDFQVEFTFRSATMEMLIGAVFTQAVHRMVASFEDRADEIYGSSAADEASGQLAPDHITK